MLLSKIVPEQAKEYFCYDLKAGLVYIRCRKLPGMGRKPLYDELVGKNPNVEMHGSHDIACPAFWFIDFLAKFYGFASTPAAHKTAHTSSLGRTRQSGRAQGLRMLG